MAMKLNDSLSQEFRDRLVPLIPKIVGTAGAEDGPKCGATWELKA